MLSVSVVICGYTEKRWHELAESIRSVQEQTLPAREIVVVVDHNRDLRLRVERRFPDIIVVENRAARGLSGARNSGIAASRGDVLAFIDDDAIAEPNWLAQLAASYDDPRVLGVGGSIEPLWPDERPSWFPDEFLWVIGCSYRGMPRSSAPVRNLIGCNMSFKREVFATVGGFRDGIGRVGVLPAGCEETELCIRVRHTWPDCELRYEPRARVYHQIPTNRIGWSYFRSRCYYEGRSKAIMTGWVGTKDGLSSERAYTLRTLPKGILRGLADTLLLQEKAGLMRAGAMIAGLTIATGGFITEKLRLKSAARRRVVSPNNDGSLPEDLSIKDQPHG